MKTCLILCFVLVTAYIADANVSPPYDVDNEVLLVFSLVSAQRRNINPTDVIDMIFPTLMDNSLDLTRAMQVDLLVHAGFTRELSHATLNEILPMMAHDGKGVQSQVMTLLLLSRQFCRKDKGFSPTCPQDEDTVLPLVAMQDPRGCMNNDIYSDSPVAESDMCRCNEQGDAMFWLTLFERFSRTVDTTPQTALVFNATSNRTEERVVPNQLPILMMMILDDMQCNGTLSSNQGSCRCTRVTEGHQAALLQYAVTSDEVQASLTPEQRAAVRAAFGSPVPRQSATLTDYIFSSMAGTSSPQMLSLLANQGESRDVMLRQLIMSSFGLDTSMVHILLNGGFGNDANKVALINYMTNIGAIDHSILPLLLQVDKGREFFISSLIQSGRINPLMGMIVLAQQGGATQTQLLDYITEAIAGSSNPAYFESLTRPYIPALPSGIFPGSQLYFAHFEALGVNTCALHDLRNRIDCGYVGISAAECEVTPYCCYNPIFLTDTEVRNATGNSITSATAVPWCYYNVFFIYYNLYYMEVKKPTKFASPVQCLRLFKYGLTLDPSLYHLYDPANPTSSVGRLVNPRYECGFPGVTEFHCVAIRGCCWDANSPFRVPQCFQPNGPKNLDFNFNNIPVAYQSPNGSCNINRYSIPMLYYGRTACHYSFANYIDGYNILSLPNRLDCLTKLGCCYENDERVVAQYPMVPRCYKREEGTIAGLPGVGALIRSGTGDSSIPIPPGYPPNTPPPPGKK
uniref:CsEpi-1 n=1 Tax=Ciona savignyi TaxID=51511 RepID=O15999_CIOSA|nr:CsEpi-1 [Ciona savignyi]